MNRGTPHQWARAPLNKGLDVGLQLWGGVPEQQQTQSPLYPLQLQ